MREPELPCPLCASVLEAASGPHGLVWVCRPCRAGAATLPVLRRVAPRGFVNRVWQTALHGGRDSILVCPSCAMPFTEIADAGGELQVCTRCFWVWVGPRTSAPAPSALLPG